MATIPTVRTWVNDFLTAVNMNEISSMLNFLQKLQGGCFYGVATTNQGITTGLSSYQAVTVNPTGLVDKDGGWSSGANTRYTAHTAGYYFVTGTAAWDITSGNKVVGIRKNNSATLLGSVLQASGLGIDAPGLITFLNGSTDYVELVCAQDSGSTVNLLSGGTGGPSSLTVVRLAGT